MSKKIQVIKLGGRLLSNSEDVVELCNKLANAKDRIVVVHGGGNMVTETCRKMNLPVHMVDGRRITNVAALEVLVMVAAGSVNKNLVSNLQQVNVNAIGLAGCDGQLIKANKRPVSNGLDYGQVGDIESINTDLLVTLIDNGYCPVIGPVSFSLTDGLLNTNADTIATKVAEALSSIYEVELLLMMDMPGVKDSSSEIISTLTPTSYAALKASGALQGGIIPKIDNALNAISNGVKCVRIGNEGLLTAATAGTTVLD